MNLAVIIFGEMYPSNEFLRTNFAIDLGYGLLVAWAIASHGMYESGIVHHNKKIISDQMW